MLTPAALSVIQTGRGNEWSCKDHRTPGMVNVKGTCKRSGCLVKTMFGQPSSRKREYCANHKKPGMADMPHKMCVVAWAAAQDSRSLDLYVDATNLAPTTKFSIKPKIFLSCAAGHDTHFVVHISHARFFVIRTILSCP